MDGRSVRLRSNNTSIPAAAATSEQIQEMKKTGPTSVCGKLSRDRTGMDHSGNN